MTTSAVQRRKDAPLIIRPDQKHWSIPTDDVVEGFTQEKIQPGKESNNKNAALAKNIYGFAGVSGTCKSLISRNLARRMGANFLETRKILRDIQGGLEKGSKLFNEIKEILERKKVQYSNELLTLLGKKSKELFQAKDKKLVFLDGFFDTAQLATLSSKVFGRISRLIQFDLPDNVIKRVIANRFYCVKCDKAYHPELDFAMPKIKVAENGSKELLCQSKKCDDAPAKERDGDRAINWDQELRNSRSRTNEIHDALVKAGIPVDQINLARKKVDSGKATLNQIIEKPGLVIESLKQHILNQSANDLLRKLYASGKLTKTSILKDAFNRNPN